MRYTVLAFLCALSFLTYFDRVCIVRAQGDIQHDLHIDDTRMGWIFSAFWLAYALFEIPGGWLAERFGARRTLTRIVLAWSLFTALSGSATGFLSLLAFRFFFGVGEAGAYPGIARVQSRWLPASAQGRASGLLWLVARWGAAFSPILFGSLLRAIDTHSFRSAIANIPYLSNLPAWRMGFISCGLAGLVWVGLFYPWFRDDPAEKPSVNNAERTLIAANRPASDSETHSKTPRHIWLAMLTSRNLWALSLGYVFGNFGWSFFVSWLPRFLLEVHHIDYRGSEWLSAAPMLCWRRRLPCRRMALRCHHPHHRSPPLWPGRPAHRRPDYRRHRHLRPLLRPHPHPGGRPHVHLHGGLRSRPKRQLGRHHRNRRRSRRHRRRLC